MSSANLLIIGPSARAAAFSALRAGLQPWCADLFADVDLRQRCPVTRLAGRYPEGFRRLLESASPGPWMYTGGLENRPRFVQRMARRRTLWGNDAMALSRCRNPEGVASLLRAAHLPALAVAAPGEACSSQRRWLHKPRYGAGGSGIRFWTPADDTAHDRRSYRQEYIEGESLALLFLGDGRTARLLGVTRQLVGEAWLHAGPFCYCGSIGPVDPCLVRHPSLEELGRLLASACLLKGLFGVDGVCREGTFWPVEINPRYTASVEVLEYATNWPTLDWHGHVFLHNQLPPPAVAERRHYIVADSLRESERRRRATEPTYAVPNGSMIGKAILFAKEDLHFPADGPWLEELRSPRPVNELLRFADIPRAHEPITAGRPILTFFAAANSPAACEDTLRQIAADLDRRLFSN